MAKRMKQTLAARIKRAQKEVRRLPACLLSLCQLTASSPQVPRAQKKQTEQRLAAEAARGAEVKAWVKAKLRKRKHALPEVIFFTKHLGLQGLHRLSHR